MLPEELDTPPETVEAAITDADSVALVVLLELFEALPQPQRKIANVAEAAAVKQVRSMIALFI